MKNTFLDDLAIQSLRVLSVEQIAKANSGHPGIALGAAPMMHTLYQKIMNVSPKNPDWFNRDRFVMAAGHGSALVYSMLHLGGFGLTINDLKGFRSLGSITPGHPEVHMTKGVDASSGPLGQGIAEGVGFAIAEEHLAARYNKENFKIVDHYTYVLCGDGDLQEGVTLEAMSLAGHLRLNKLIVLYDSNDIQLDGEVSSTYSESMLLKAEAINWNYILVKDGENVNEIQKALEKSKKSDKPTIIEIKTVIGHGTNVAGSSKAHGSPLIESEVNRLRETLGGEKFSVPSEVVEYYQSSLVEEGYNKFLGWEKLFKEYQETFPQLASELLDAINGKINFDFSKDIISFDTNYNKATRQSSGEVIDAISKIYPNLIGGTADLSSSTKAKVTGGVFTKDNRIGRNINFGVREHAMTAICNGIALHKGLKAFCSTFFVFSDYMKPAIRLASLMDLPVIYVLTHDSVAVGEDGPTHQPIEQLTMLRGIPNIQVIRPSDAVEVKEAWEIALKSTHTPTCLVLTRQDVPTIRTNDNQNMVQLGGYVISKELNNLDGILIASGSEVQLAIKVQEELLKENISVRVVSMPSINLFEKQSKEYKESIIPSAVKNIMAIEMSEGAHYYKYVGRDGIVYGINQFGLSAKAELVLQELGYTVDQVKEAYKSMLK